MIEEQTKVQTNRHPVDRLADVRAQIKELGKLEKELRDVVASDECNLVGDQFEAKVTHQVSERVDIKALRAGLGDEVVRPFVKASEFVTVKVKAREVLEDVG